MNNWKNLIQSEMENHGEKFQDVVSCTLSNDELLLEFDNGYGGSCGLPFTLWTKKRVYFPIVYDGSEWVGSASRDPDGLATQHQGGQ